MSYNFFPYFLRSKSNLIYNNIKKMSRPDPPVTSGPGKIGLHGSTAGLKYPALTVLCKEIHAEIGFRHKRKNRIKLNRYFHKCDAFEIAVGRSLMMTFSRQSRPKNLLKLSTFTAFSEIFLIINCRC